MVSGATLNEVTESGDAAELFGLPAGDRSDHPVDDPAITVQETSSNRE